MSLVTKTAWELQQLIDAGEVHPRELVQAFVDRIDALDPAIGAFLARMDGDAFEVASRGGGGRWGGGIPIALKDNYYTAGIPTTAGSRMLEGYVPRHDAPLVERLRQAGMPILGKTNMDEFAMGPSTENSAFQVTRNPWDRSRVPGGSSGGSAAAVAAHLVPWALGSDTGGSVRQPAALCGVVGLKPTYGRLPTEGLVPLVPSLDCAGCITKDVRDAALLFGILSGEAAGKAAGNGKPPYVAELGRDIQGLKVGLPREYLGPGVEGDVREAIARVAEVLEGLGAHVEEMSLPSLGLALAAYYALSSVEAGSVIASYVEKARAQASGAARAGDGSAAGDPAAKLGLEPKWRMVLGAAVANGTKSIPKSVYGKAQAVREAVAQEFLGALQRWDVLIGPTTPGGASPLGTPATDAVKAYAANLCTIPVNLAGLPAISVPCGLDHQGLPLGVQFIGPPGAEAAILKVAYAYEQESGSHRLRLGEQLP